MLGRILNLLAFLLVLATSNLYAANFNLQQAGNYELSQSLEYWQDLENHSSLSHISQLAQWQPSDTDNLNLGFSPSPYWFKTTINLQQSELNWFIRITYPPLDTITLYNCQVEVVNDIERECEISQTGDRIPFNQRARFNPNYIIPVDLKPGKNFIYIKVATEGSYQLPISILDKQNLDDYLAVNDFFRGGYLTLMLVMMLYNLFIFFMTRSPTYLLYSGFVFTFALFHMTYEGSGFQYLWPQWPELNQVAMPIAFSINQIFIILFITNFLNIKRSSQTTYYYFNTLLAIAVATLILVPAIPYKLFIPLMNLLSITIIGSAFLMGLKYWRQGQSSARLFTIAWAVLITGILTANLRTLGIFPSNFFTQYGYQIGSFVEIVLLSLALGERIQRLQNERLQAEQALMQEKQDRMSALQQLIIGVSHEMNTPIGNIGLSNSFLNTINRDLKQKDTEGLTRSELEDHIELQNEAIKMIETSSKTLASLTHVFSNISIKKKDHPATEFDLVNLIQDRALTYQDKIDFDLKLPKSCVIHSHPSAFLLVFNQLFDNVVTHVMTSAQQDNALVKVTLQQSKNALLLVISDNGDGLSDTELSQLFLPFYTKSRGSGKKMGLGMYQVKNIISDLLDGTIEPETSSAGGLKLTIEFKNS
jgi:signal transduction histidine kinase